MKLDVKTRKRYHKKMKLIFLTALVIQPRMSAEEEEIRKYIDI